MPLPPPKSRKHATNGDARETRARALAPHRFTKGESGNPEGFGGSRRAAYEEIARIAISGAPEELRNLQRLARESADERVRVMASKTFLDFVPRSVLEKIVEREFVSSPAKMTPQERTKFIEAVNRLNDVLDGRVIAAVPMLPKANGLG